MNSKPLNKDIILNALHIQKGELKKYGVQRIGLFGSFVRGENTNDSDIDLLVDFDKEKKTLRNLVHLGTFLKIFLTAR